MQTDMNHMKGGNMCVREYCMDSYLNDKFPYK